MNTSTNIQNGVATITMTLPIYLENTPVTMQDYRDMVKLQILNTIPEEITISETVDGFTTHSNVPNPDYINVDKLSDSEVIKLFANYLVIEPASKKLKEMVEIEKAREAVETAKQIEEQGRMQAKAIAEGVAQYVNNAFVVDVT